MILTPRSASKRFIPVLLALALGLLLWSAAPPTAGAQATDEAEVGVRGVLFTLEEKERTPVEGATITVRSPGGEELGSATTDAEGAWAITLPGPGSYEAQIDTDSLPDDVELRDAERETQPFSLRPGQTRSILFPLGDDPRNVASKWEQALSLAVKGVNFGLIIGMAAVGLSLIFGTTGLTNFAHGEMVTFGALIAWFFNQTVGWALIPSALLAIVFGAGMGGLFDLGVWRPLRKRRTGLIAMLVISIGISLAVRYVFLYQFGGRTQPFNQFAIQAERQYGPFSVTPRDLISIVLSIVVLGLVGLLLQKTKIGKAMRAVADNPDLAASSGIDVERVILTVWLCGGALAALGGVLLGLAEQVSWQGGFRLLLLMFAGVTLGGLGTAYGALVGSFIIGMLIQVGTLWVPPELKTVPALAVLIVILLIRPQGILGRAERIG